MSRPAGVATVTLGDVAANVTSGVVIAILNVTTAVSMAALMFAGMSPELFVVGVSILLVSTAVCALGGAIGSGFGATVLVPRSGLAPIYAAMTGSVAAALPAEDPAFLPTMLVTIALGTAGAGAFMILVGLFRFGALIRYVPYPVMAGFFAGIGVIFILGSLTVAGGSAVGVDSLDFHLSFAGLKLTLPAIALGLALYAVTRRFDHWSVFPLFLIAAIVVFYALLGISGGTRLDAVAAGWLPEPSEAVVSFPLLRLADLAAANWSVVLAQAGAFASVALLSTIILLVDTSGIEMIGETDLDPDRELRAAGVTNVINGGLGGYAGVQTAADTALAVKLGAGRLAGFVFAALVGLIMLVGTDVVSAVPSFVLGGLLFYLGADFLIDWAWSKRRDFPPHDYAVVLAILVVITFVGLLEGIAFGFFLAIILFVVSYSRLSVVKGEHSGADHDSIVVRNAEHRAYLRSESRRIWIMRLQGFLFFGTADRVLRTIRERVERAAAGEARDTAAAPCRETPGPPIDHLVLDFTHVSELDTSAIQTFAKLRKIADREGLTIVLTDLDARAAERLAAVGFFDGAGADPRGRRAGRGLSFPTLAEGVAWCEAELLRHHEGGADGAAGELEHQLAGLLANREAARALAPYFAAEELPGGAYVFREGEQGTDLFLLGSGVASVVMNAETGVERIVRIFEEGTILGEMAMFTGEPRTASVRVERSAIFYRLTRESFLEAQSTEPAAAGLLQSCIIRLLADRLERANREIRSLA